MTEQELLRKLEKQLNEHYKDTESVIKGKIEDFTKNFEKDNKTYLEKLKSGEIDEKAYKKWYKEQVTTQKWCNDMIRELSEDMTNANVKASDIINGYTSDLYLNGCLEASGEFEDLLGFDLIDRRQVDALMKDNKPMLPKSRVPISKDEKWNERRMRSAVLQSALKGEPVPKLAKRLQYIVGMNRSSSVRNARTMMTSSHNMGKLNTAQEALDMGINVKKVWIATYDNRTRDSHAEMDGVTIPIDEPFVLTNMDGSKSELMYPADPDGDPEQVYNCRCTMGYEIGDPDELREENFEVVDGEDITDTWERRPDEFDFEIEDAINAQGFDGVPRVVDADEFDKYVEESNFIAQRTYSAPDQETLDMYREQLYNGKWYVDCGTGGSQYGQGMYCAADYNGVLSDGIKSEMEHYKELGGQRFSEAKKQAREQYLNNAINNADSELERVALKEKIFGNTTEKEWDLYSTRTREQDRYFSKLADTIEDKASKIYGFNYTETITLDKSAKIITYSELQQMRGYGNFERMALGKMNISNKDRSILSKWIEDEGYVDELPNRLRGIGKELENKADKMMKMDQGSLATLLGYDAINAEGHGASGSYTVILNRTKVIFKRS